MRRRVRKMLKGKVKSLSRMQKLGSISSSLFPPKLSKDKGFSGGDSKELELSLMFSKLHRLVF